MARTEIERTVLPSVFDRLTDEQPGVPADPPTSRDDSVRAYRLAVQRDVEWLLNTRRTMERAPESCPELRNSVYEYGLIDTTGLAVGTKQGRDQLVSALRDALARFEPRLGDPRLRMLDADQVRSPQVRFLVEALLRLDPSPEMVVFDTVLDVASGEYGVDESGAAGA